MKNRDDLPFFLNGLGLTNIGIEVGVCKGLFSAHILKNWHGKKLYLIDSWRHFSGIEDVNNGDHNEQLDNIARTFMNIYPFDSRAVIVRDYSTEAAELFQDKSIDFVYIDAGHDYKSVTKDLICWFPKVKSGGYFLGHDYTDGYFTFMVTKECDKEPVLMNGLVEVRSAVDDFAKGRGLVVYSTEEKEFPSWFIKV